MSLPPKKYEHVAQKLHDEVQNRNYQRNAHQIVDITMNSPGNVALQSMRPINGPMFQSPVRVGASFENSKFSGAKRASQVGSVNKEVLPPLGLPPSGKRNRNDNYLPQIPTQKAEANNYESLKMNGSQTDKERYLALSQKRSTVTGSKKSEKDAIRSQILDHLVDRVSKHENERHSRRSSHKQQASEILSRLQGSHKGSKRLGLKSHKQNGSVNEEMLRTGFSHYDSSPVAKHYYADPGFLMTFNGTIPERIGFNRKLKMRDTFTKIFPSYNHEPATCYSPSNTHTIHFYPSKWDDGSPAHKIDRKYTHKFDEIKIYNEEMLKIAEIADMRRPANKAPKKAK